ncbi:MAG: hypothetical protein WKF37_03475 [Bryobacteraceae bacterium]
MPANLLLLPLLGGYWFIHNLHYTRYRSHRLDGYRLLLECALAGLLFTVGARILVVLLRAVPAIKELWLRFAPADIPYLGTACTSLLIGALAPYLLNFALEKTRLLSKEQAYYRAVLFHGNHLLILLHSAAREERAVSLTLDNKKVYIGLITDAPTLEAHETFLTIYPILSGYRDDRMNLILTVDYSHVYLQHVLDPTEFPVTMPISSIRMAGYFDQAIHSSFTVQAGPAVAEDSSTTPAREHVEQTACENRA